MKKVFVNGCFDVLHRGHIELFAYAKTHGDYLIVAIDSDDRVKQSKGPTRPVNNQDDRAYLLRSIRYIDEVVTFNTSGELENLIYKYYPDVMIVGSDWKDKQVIGSEYAKELLFFDRIGGYSTTKVLSNEVRG